MYDCVGIGSRKVWDCVVIISPGVLVCRDSEEGREGEGDGRELGVM